MKKTQIIVAIIMLLSLLTGCSNDNKQTNVNIPVESTVRQIETEKQTEPVTTQVEVIVPETKAAKKLQQGMVINGKKIKVNVLSIYSTDIIEPPVKDGYYQYFEADSGKKYIVVKIKATNIDKNNYTIGDIADISCVFDGQYNYNGSCIFEERGGTSLNTHPGIYYISPLTDVICYYVLNVPEQVAKGPVNITFLFDDEEYQTGNISFRN